MSISNRESIDHMCVKKGKFFSWTAVMVGALVGLGISFLLNLFGIGIGLAAFKYADATNVTFALGGFLALLIVSIVSMTALGAVAGYLGAMKKLACNRDERVHCNYGCLYGFTAWCLALILSALLAAPIGKFISYTTTALTNPTYVLTESSIYKRQVMQTNTMSTAASTATAKVTSGDPTKQLALTSFISFILFFVGALSATIAGHLAFDRCVRKHGGRID